MSAQMHAQATYVRLENYTKACEIIIFFVMKQTKKPWMCSVHTPQVDPAEDNPKKKRTWP